MGKMPYQSALQFADNLITLSIVKQPFWVMRDLDYLVIKYLNHTKVFYV